MSVSGLCEICQRRDVEHTCDRCGKLVCSRHYAASVNLCTECAAEVGAPTDVDEGERDRPDGVDEYQF